MKIRISERRIQVQALQIDLDRPLGDFLRRTEFAGMRAEWLTPRAPARGKVMLYLHGGAYVFGNCATHRQLVSYVARACGVRALVIEYRLAPEHPFPIPFDDCHSALRWIAREGASLGGDPARIAIGGSSAGGNLAAALAIRARDEGGPAVAFQLLVVPATDLSGTRDWHSFDEAGEGYVLTAAGIEEMIDAYVPDPRARMHPYVSPLLEGDLSGLPPALVVTALFDPLRDQGEAYARRLEAAGARVAWLDESAAPAPQLGLRVPADQLEEPGGTARLGTCRH